MKLCEILYQDGRRAALPRGLAELLARHYGTEAEYLFSAIHGDGTWSVYLHVPNTAGTADYEHVVGTYDAWGWRLGGAHADSGCWYNLPDCAGSLWTCRECGEEYCERHHGTGDLCDACRYDDMMERAVAAALR